MGRKKGRKGEREEEEERKRERKRDLEQVGEELYIVRRVGTITSRG